MQMKSKTNQIIDDLFEIVARESISPSSSKPIIRSIKIQPNFKNLKNLGVENLAFI